MTNTEAQFNYPNMARSSDREHKTRHACTLLGHAFWLFCAYHRFYFQGNNKETN